MDCSNIAPTVIAIVIGSFVATFLLLFVPQHETPTVELLLFYFQVVNLIFGVEITSFDGMVDLEKFLALASLDIDGMTTSCPAPLTGVAKQLFRFVLPFLFFIHAAILYLTAQFLRSWNPALMEKLLMYLPVHSKHISVKVIFLRITQILITFVLMPLVEASLAILDCRSLMGRNVDFQAPDEKCFGPNHMPAAIFAIVMLILLLGVYPTMLVFQLRKLKINNRLKYDVDPDSLTVIDELNLTLYADYRQSYYFMGPILVWEKGVLVLLFKLLLGKVNGIGFTYVAILAVLCFERIYVQPYLFGIEAYMNREIVLCWLILMAINLSTLESGFNQNVGGVITFLLILPAALHICRWAYSAYRGRNPDSMAGGSITDSQSALGGTGSKHGLARKGSAKGNSIENLTGRPKGSKKGGSGAGSSTSHTHKNSSSARESNLGTGSIQAAPLQRTNSQMGMRTGSIIKSTALGVTSPVGRASGSGVSTVPAVSGPYGLGTLPPSAGSRHNLELVGEVDSNHVQYDFVEKQVI
ncbi:hypothetical protein BCR33DRAFT_453286 [Rhizoclosmatium globosum]|uniref:TRP C-terminal domain-containing protein n=1 Tax=Rhizoclosmatium globosum TaxID=329046 RepID=A0A1Y2CWK4_9FUNG|nr:hypothetical protein BCR33DRAFT_453286 [Rhizoclosmatium globosum]|eukprot:ORY51367.1 hypothetical protein BCR33DRAFT_453286 [Rhizoclosmatium globosum]